MQTAGELDYGTIFEEDALLYTPMAYILFILFVILMPILFNNLLVGLAVEVTEEDAERATFTNIQLQVDFIVQMEDSSHLRHWGNLTEFKHSEDEKKNWFLAKLDKMRGLDYKSQEKLWEELYEETLDSEGKHKEAVQVLKEKVTQMAEKMESLEEKIPALERSHKQLQEALQDTLENSMEENKEAVQVLKEKVTQMAEKMESLEEKIPALERSHKQLQEALQDTLESSMEENKARMKTLESIIEDLQSDVGKILEKLES
jgi:prefoldin subunit 5